MKLALSQWIAWFALDLLIKTTVVTLFGMLVTLGAAPFVVFVRLGIFLSVVHFFCVCVGLGATELIKLAYQRSSVALDWIITFLAAHTIFLCLFGGVSHKVIC